MERNAKIQANKNSGDNSDNVKHQQVILDHLNKNKDNDP